jgi:hypothetical protein
VDIYSQRESLFRPAYQSALVSWLVCPMILQKAMAEMTQHGSRSVRSGEVSTRAARRLHKMTGWRRWANGGPSEPRRRSRINAAKRREVLREDELDARTTEQAGLVGVCCRRTRICARNHFRAVEHVGSERENNLG